MSKISANGIFKEVKNEIFNLKEKGELEVPILGDKYQIPTDDDMLKAFWQDENAITVKYNGQKRLVPCHINSDNDDYIARCIMSGFAQICLNRNEGKTINKQNMLNIVENTITRLVNEGVMDIDGTEEEESHFITDNNNIILRLLEEICSGYSHYVTCDIDKYDAFVDFGDLYIIVSIDDNGYIYVNKVEGSVSGDKGLSAELWKEVGECITKINAFGKKLTDIHIGGKTFESKLHESFRNNQGYTHFAVNKSTGKIVNGWDYSGYEADELKAFKRDYFFVDLEDYGFNPKDYVIYTGKTLKKRGVDPDDNSNWANS